MIIGSRASKLTKNVSRQDRTKSVLHTIGGRGSMNSRMDSQSAMKTLKVFDMLHSSLSKQPKVLDSSNKSVLSGCSAVSSIKDEDILEHPVIKKEIERRIKD